jgi:hypothetical protein
MELGKKFEEATSCHLVHVSSSEVERKYPIVHAERVNTKYWPTVLLTIVDSTLRTLKVFLPKRYAPKFSDLDIEDINPKQVSLYLINKGKCVKANSYILAVECKTNNEWTLQEDFHEKKHEWIKIYILYFFILLQMNYEV